jgi:hypothetical protein
LHAIVEAVAGSLLGGFDGLGHHSGDIIAQDVGELANLVSLRLNDITNYIHPVVYFVLD